MPWAAMIGGVTAGYLSADAQRWKAQQRYRYGRDSWEENNLERAELLREMRTLKEPAAFEEWHRKFKWAGVKHRVLDKEKNMSTRMQRRREHIAIRWRLRLKAAAVAILGVFVALPIVIALASYAWRWAVQAVLE